MFLLLASFLAGVLTSLAPCILPLLPVIVGSSLIDDGDIKQDRLKPYIITFSLAASVVVFTLLLKISTVFIGVDPVVWLYISGGIVVVIGLSMLFPEVWARISARIGLEHSTNSWLSKAYRKKGRNGAVLTGIALGPVFSSCSPVYALVLATVLPTNIALGIVYIFAYAIGLGLALLAVSLAGRRLIKHLHWAVDPNGIFRKILAVILILVGILIISGYDKRFQTWAAEHVPFGVGRIEEKLVPNANTNLSAEGSNGQKLDNVKAYPAPEIQGISEWINSSPQTIAGLKGKVVLIDFWTYSCINCIRTQSYLNDWYSKYEKDGLVIIGVHAPEFAFEKVPENVRKAVNEASIKYPVALDNDFSTWRAYGNSFWPAKYLIDKNGQVRFTHFGEGNYDETEKAIQALLSENGQKIDQKISNDLNPAPVVSGQTPETYLGYERGERFANVDQFKEKPVAYSATSNLMADQWTLDGLWDIQAMQIVPQQNNATLRINFSSKEVYLVMDGERNTSVRLKLNGQNVTASHLGGQDVDSAGNVFLNGARLYKLIKLDSFKKNQILEITFPQAAKVNAFTFGS